MHISVNPNPKLIKGRGSTDSPHYMSNKTPNVSRHITVKKQMFYAFKHITEKTSFIALLIFPAKGVLSQDRISINQPHEYLNFHGYFSFPQSLLWVIPL
jgi:hypothetical protein